MFEKRFHSLVDSKQTGSFTQKKRFFSLRDSRHVLSVVFKKRFWIIDEHYLHIWQFIFPAFYMHRNVLPATWSITSTRSSSNVFWTIDKETMNSWISTISDNVQNGLEGLGLIMISSNVFWTMRTVLLTFHLTLWRSSISTTSSSYPKVYRIGFDQFYLECVLDDEDHKENCERKLHDEKYSDDDQQHQSGP